MSPGRPGNRSFPYEFFKVYLPDQSSQRMELVPSMHDLERKYISTYDYPWINPREDFSRKFLAEHGIKMEPETSLRDDDGKKWPVCIYHHSDGRVSIGKGWADFRNHHKIVCRAKCAFEFVLRRGRKCREIAVHILHAEGV